MISFVRINYELTIDSGDCPRRALSDATCHTAESGIADCAAVSGETWVSRRGYGACDGQAREPGVTLSRACAHYVD